MEMSREEILKSNVGFYLNKAFAMVSDDYRNDIIRAVQEDVIDDVATSSGYADGEDYNYDDIALALGRVLVEKLGIER